MSHVSFLFAFHILDLSHISLPPWSSTFQSFHSFSQCPLLFVLSLSLTLCIHCLSLTLWLITCLLSTESFFTFGMALASCFNWNMNICMCVFIFKWYGNLKTMRLIQSMYVMKQHCWIDSEICVSAVIMFSLFLCAEQHRDITNPILMTVFNTCSSSHISSSSLFPSLLILCLFFSCKRATQSDDRSSILLLSSQLFTLP